AGGRRVAERERRAVAGDRGAAAGRREGGEPVLEHHHVVVRRGNLGVPPVTRGAQRTLVGGGQEGAGLPVRGDDQPFVDQWVVPQLGRRRWRREATGVDRRPDRVARLVEVEDRPAVGQPVGGPSDAGHRVSNGAGGGNSTHTKRGRRRCLLNHGQPPG